LKIREDLSRNEILRLKNEGIAEVQLIKQEIEKNKKEEQAKVRLYFLHFLLIIIVFLRFRQRRR
jgi:hypothetical protein